MNFEANMQLVMVTSGVGSGLGNWVTSHQCWGAPFKNCWHRATRAKEVGNLLNVIFCFLYFVGLCLAPHLSFQLA